MSDSYWQKIEDIFPLALALSAEEREARLPEICRGDEALCREILALLAADEKVGQFIETPATMPDSLRPLFLSATDEDQISCELVGDRIGPYKIIRKLSAGGMGAVYLAERDDGEFQKKVAVKLIRNGMESTFNLRRFRHERQILATMDHPNIARLLSGGTTAEGSPYFVMEFIDGEQFFHFCNSRKLDIKERLHLFKQVCSAVSYAHGLQIIHRDIKPGNILVKADGNAKLLDFGIAKILDADLLDETINPTATFMHQLTPEYASPEQIFGEEITPASDVYSLGMVLYELVTGERPYKFKSRSPFEIARVVCEQEVQSLQSKIQSRETESERSETDLRLEDLDKIILKTLRKNPAARYASVADLIADIERFLVGEVVRAESLPFEIEHSRKGPDSFTRSLVVVPFQMLGPEENADDKFWGIGLADVLTTHLSRVRQINVRPTSSVLRLAAENANAYAIGAKLNADFVLDGNIWRVGNHLRVTVQLHRTCDNSVAWASQFEESETEVFALQDLIAEKTVASLVPQLTNEEQRRLLVIAPSNAAAFEAYLRGRALWHTYNIAGIAKSIAYFRESIAHDPNFALAYSGIADYHNWIGVAGVLPPTDCFIAAKEAANKAIELDENLAEAHASLAFATWAYDRNAEEAEQLFRRAIDLNTSYPQAHEWLSYLLSGEARHDEAIDEMRHAEQLAPNSPAIATMFAFIFYNARRFEEAHRQNLRGLEIDPDYYVALQGMGWVLPHMGRPAEGVEYCRRAVANSDQLGFNKWALATTLALAGEREEAQKLADELEAQSLRQYVPPYYLATIYACLGDQETAFRWCEKAVSVRDYWLNFMRVETRFDLLRSDSRFQNILDRVQPQAAQSEAPLVA